VTVTHDHVLEVSNRLRDAYHNGRSYYPLHGTRITLPAIEADRPSRELLAWHNQHVFLS
jgi:putative restriction endonuclease